MLLRARVISIMIATTTFLSFTKSLGSKYTLINTLIRDYLNLKMLNQQNQKHDLKKSGLLKMLETFTSSIMMPTKRSMTMVVS